MSPPEGLPADCISFLQHLRGKNASHDSTTGHKLHVLICGGGISGLATAIALSQNKHKVTLLEAGTGEQHGGFGLQIAPNFSRVLLDLGLESQLEHLAVWPEHVLMRRWQNGALIGEFRLRELGPRFGAPYLQMHRGVLHAELMQRAIQLGVTIRSQCRVSDYDLEAAHAILASGETVTSDLLVVADGLASSARRQFGVEASISPKLAVYRTVLEVEKLRMRKETAWLGEHPQGQCWCGPGSHVVLYPMTSTSMTLTLTLPVQPATEEHPDYKQELFTLLKGWDPAITQLLETTDTIVKWPLPWSEELKTTVGLTGRSVLVGDAAHYMTPWMGQGGAMCAEDATTLAHVLQGISESSQLPLALRTFDALRQPRTRAIRAYSLKNAQMLHMEDGDEQQKRDADATECMKASDPKSRNPFVWSDPQVQDIIFGYTAETAALEAIN